jgi:hypothetical protein
MLRGLQCDLLQVYAPQVWLHFYSLFSHMRSASLTHPTVLMWTPEYHEIQTPKLLTVQFPPVPRYLVPHRPKYFLSTLFSNTISLCSSVNVKRQVSHPYKTTHKIKVLNILISKREDKRAWTERSQISPESNLFLISFVHAIPICKCRSQTSELVHFFKGLMLHSVDQTWKYTLLYF